MCIRDRPKTFEPSFIKVISLVFCSGPIVIDILLSYPKKFVIDFGKFDLIGFHIAMSILPKNFGLGINQPINIPNNI